jgi:hypothetical protein
MKVTFNPVEFAVTVPIAIIGIAIIWWQAGGWLALGVLLVAFAAGMKVKTTPRPPPDIPH